MKIGVLYPRSIAHPSLGLDFMDGLTTFLKERDLEGEITMVAIGIGFGGSGKEVYDSVENLIVINKVDVIIGYISNKLIELIEPLLRNFNKLMLVVSPGADYPINWEPSPNILHLNLHHGFLCWLTGAWASEINKRALLATTFYDSGYLHIAAMVNSFQAAGGEIQFNYINNQRYDTGFNIVQLTDFLSFDKETNTLLCVFDTLPGSLFFEKINESEEAADLNLFVSPMMLESEALSIILNKNRFNIRGYLPWHHSLDIESNKDFIRLFSNRNSREATAFGVLGWETGMICNEFFTNFNVGLALERVHSGLAGALLNSPRGNLQFDNTTNHFLSPIIQFNLNSYGEKEDLKMMKIKTADWEKFVQYPVEGISSGWSNTYLCY